MGVRDSKLYWPTVGFIDFDTFPFWPDFGLFILNTRARHLGLPQCRAFTVRAILAWRARHRAKDDGPPYLLYEGALRAATALERGKCFLVEHDPPKDFVDWELAQLDMVEWWKPTIEQRSNG